MYLDEARIDLGRTEGILESFVVELLVDARGCAVAVQHAIGRIERYSHTINDHHRYQTIQYNSRVVAIVAMR